MLIEPAEILPPQQLQTAQNKSEQDAAIYKEFPEVKMVLADATPMDAPKTIGILSNTHNLTSHTALVSGL